MFSRNVQAETLSVHFLLVESLQDGAALLENYTKWRREALTQFLDIILSKEEVGIYEVTIKGSLDFKSSNPNWMPRCDPPCWCISLRVGL